MTGGTYIPETYYTAGVTQDATNALEESRPLRQTPGTPASDTNGTGGVATISYSDDAGQSLSAPI